MTVGSEPPAPGPARLPRHLDVVFGLVVISAFGSWFYGFGVLVSPIVADGIPEQVAATAYGLGLFGAGAGAMLAGRWSDRRDTRGVFVGGAIVVAVATAAVAAASHWLVFAVAAVVTGTTIGALGHYSLVHATIARLAPLDRTRAITVNTLWGAFASPIFLPLMGAMVTWWSWRVAMVVANATVVATFLAVAAVLPAEEAVVGAPGTTDDDPADVTAGWRRLLGTGAVARLALVAGLGGVVTSILLLYQVPAMAEAGLGLGLAATLAGGRGLLQLAGRIPLPWVIRRVGSSRTFSTSLLLLAVAALLLPATGSLPTALAFVVVGGVAVGATTTVENIFAAEVVPAAGIGASLGALSLARGIGSAVGPAAAGQVTAAADSHAPALVAIAVLAVVAALLVGRVRPAGPARRSPP